MARLTSAERNALSRKSFAIPPDRYPIEDPDHARDALSRVSANGTPAEKSQVRAAVHSRFPQIQQAIQRRMGGK